MYPSKVEWMIYSYIEMMPRNKEEVTTATRIDIRNSHRLGIEPKEARHQGAHVMSPCIGSARKSTTKMTEVRIIFTLV